MAETTTTARRVRRRRKHRWAFPLGLMMVVLALVGIGTILFFAVQGVRNLANHTNEYGEYQEFLTPIVMFDPDSFDDLTQAKPAQLIDCSIWALLTGDLEPDQYLSDSGSLIVPQADVEAEFARLFGTDMKPVHQTVDGYGYQFAYDAAAGTYTVPLTGVSPIYTPQIESVSKKGSTRTVIVAYVASNQWAQDAQGNMVPVMADKYMKATLRDNGAGGYYLSALQPTDAPERARVPNTTAAPETVTDSVPDSSLPDSSVQGPDDTAGETASDPELPAEAA